MVLLKVKAERLNTRKIAYDRERNADGEAVKVPLCEVFAAFTSATLYSKENRNKKAKKKLKTTSIGFDV
jgi:hypothetical protein